ncbi:hypothetical protein Xsto_03779 [Xenorhabdus stockiae]|uniref:Uncharacterized protein n=1 Tax=Xenorhabdus stockiae TaxID=351614 RepID=A0A2D0KB44_9GAMM|nr:hypothetical protein [Xenorhabdus stockiae]PHM60668.1 hypothetical protein Xsto_03779 [Xenorhabdus stockiae]
MKETGIIKKNDIALDGDEELLPYWISVRSRELENNQPYIVRDALSDEDLYYWLRYQAEMLKAYIDAKNEKAAELERLQEIEKIIKKYQPLVEQEKFYFPHVPILQEESYQK